MRGQRENYYIALVTGDRFYDIDGHYNKMQNILGKLHDRFGDHFIVVAGEAPGADTLAKAVCQANGWWFIGVPAPWKRFSRGKGNPAGPLRNTFMLRLFEPNVVLSFHPDLDKSTGTKDCIRQAEKMNITVRKYK